MSASRRVMIVTPEHYPIEVAVAGGVDGRRVFPLAYLGQCTATWLACPSDAEAEARMKRAYQMLFDFDTATLRGHP